MLKPSLNELVESGHNRYSLVIATAKIARDIAERAQHNKVILEEKPVTLSIEQLSQGKFNIIMPKNDNVRY